MEPTNSANDVAQNIPNLSMMGMLYNSMFGNIGFQIQPSQTGEVSNTFGTIPALSLEGIIQQQQLVAQASPTNMLPGQHSGQQNIQGNYTITDETGNVRMVMGFQRGGFS